MAYRAPSATISPPTVSASRKPSQDEFKTGPPNEVYGPFKDAIPLPMKNGLGIEPKDTPQDQIESSALCGSCHTILLPVYTKDGVPVQEHGTPKLFYEQATYIEWLNSDFQNEIKPLGADPQTCQHCHMPTDYKGNKLSYKIANIEDNTFPPIAFRAPDKDITMELRDPFYRHTLLGINLFALEMFGQFRTDLGLYQTDPMLPNPDQTTSSHDTAVASSLDLAAKSAKVNILSAKKANGSLQADVEVVNLAGHSLPSGVGFRRAFLSFRVLDSRGRTLWVSGNTSADGVIVDGAGKPLVTEFFGPAQQKFQVHHWKDNPITSEDQVEIYEELVVNPEGRLTTSFLSLDQRVKDNRLQPKGWKPNGPYAGETKAVGTGADPSYTNGSGSSIVRYAIPLNARTSQAAQVQATLYYQTIPPYYLRQRKETGEGSDTQRLLQFTQQLKVEKTPVANWRLCFIERDGRGPMRAKRAVPSRSGVVWVGRNESRFWPRLPAPDWAAVAMPLTEASVLRTAFDPQYGHLRRLTKSAALACTSRLAQRVALVGTGFNPRWQPYQWQPGVVKAPVSVENNGVGYLRANWYTRNLMRYAPELAKMGVVEEWIEGEAWELDGYIVNGQFGWFWPLRQYWTQNKTRIRKYRRARSFTGPGRVARRYRRSGAGVRSLGLVLLQRMAADEVGMEIDRDSSAAWPRRGSGRAHDGLRGSAARRRAGSLRRLREAPHGAAWISRIRASR